MYKTSLRNFAAGMKQKKAIQKQPMIVTDVDYDYIMDEIERREKLSLKGMLVLKIMMNLIDDDNNNNAIFNVVLHYIIIKK